MVSALHGMCALGWINCRARFQQAASWQQAAGSCCWLAPLLRFSKRHGAAW
jgi:hypothetical protein